MSVYTVVFSEAYAVDGSQLKDVLWQGIVCLKGAEGMSQTEFEDAAYSFGNDLGVERRDVNVNNFFMDTLPGRRKAGAGDGCDRGSGDRDPPRERTRHLQCVLSVCSGAHPSVRAAAHHRDDKKADTQDGAYGRACTECGRNSGGACHRRDRGVFHTAGRMELAEHASDLCMCRYGGCSYRFMFDPETGEDGCFHITGRSRKNTADMRQEIKAADTNRPENWRGRSRREVLPL